MIEHEVDDVDYGVIIKRGDKTIHRFGYKYPEDDDLVPNEERIDSCLLTDLNFDGIKEVNLQVLKAIAFTQTEDFLKECKLLNLDKQDVANTLKLLEIYDYKLNFSFKGKSNNNIEKHFQISANDISAYLNR